MDTRKLIEDERNQSRKKFPDFYRDLDEYHSKRGLPKSIRRHEVKERNKKLIAQKMPKTKI